MILDEMLGYVICRVARKIHYRIDEAFTAYGITVEQWSALKIIEEHEQENLCQKELAGYLEKNQNTVKTLVSHLEQKEFIKRSPDAHDKRNMLLHTTEKGQLLIQKLSALDQKANLDLLEDLSHGEREALKKILAKIEKRV